MALSRRRGLHQRRAVEGDFVAELADFDIADDEDGFVFAQFGLAGGTPFSPFAPVGSLFNVLIGLLQNQPADAIGDFHFVKVYDFMGNPSGTSSSFM